MFKGMKAGWASEAQGFHPTGSIQILILGDNVPRTQAILKISSEFILVRPLTLVLFLNLAGFCVKSRKAYGNETMWWVLIPLSTYTPEQRCSTGKGGGRRILHISGNIGECLQTFFLLSLGGVRWQVLLAFSRQRLGMLLSVLQGSTGQPTQRMILPQMSILPGQGPYHCHVLYLRSAFPFHPDPLPLPCGLTWFSALLMDSFMWLGVRRWCPHCSRAIRFSLQL